MKKYLFSFLLFSLGTTAFCTTWTVTNTGFAFTPATITITVGDDVNFVLESAHNAREVSLSNWNVNNITPLPGFSTPFGGGLVSSSQLTVGTHYYVCQNHGTGGMKGIIIVQAVTGMDEPTLQSGISIFPNPTGGKFKLDISGLHFEKSCNLEICDVSGEKIYQAKITNAISEIDLSNRQKGIYFLKIIDGQAVITKKILIE